jgi:quercetin dioxygenase-like cupin family protein
VDFVHSMVTIQPRGSSGWHTHPGIVLVTVASGSLTFYDDQCQATEHPPGSSFVEAGDDAGFVRNLSSSVTATVHATYLVPVGTTVLRIDKPDPGCPQS